MNLVFDSFQARVVVNVHKHVDGAWFWDKYTAHPYVGCRSDCSFCFSRDGRYAGRSDPSRFASEIRVKTKAAELLRRQLARRERELICSGDWQLPAERRFRLSRAMLEVIADLGFPPSPSSIVARAPRC